MEKNPRNFVTFNFTLKIKILRYGTSLKIATGYVKINWGTTSNETRLDSSSPRQMRVPFITHREKMVVDYAGNGGAPFPLAPFPKKWWICYHSTKKTTTQPYPMTS